MKAQPTYTRGKYNIKNRVETIINIKSTNDFKAQFKKFCKENHINMSAYIRKLILEDYCKIMENKNPELYN